MAGNKFTVTSGEVMTGTGSWKSLLGVKASANVGIKCEFLGVYFKGTNAAAAKVRVRVVRGTAISAGTPVARTKKDPLVTENIQATAIAEPTAGGTPVEIDAAQVSPIGFVERPGSKYARIPAAGEFTVQVYNGGTDVGVEVIGEFEE